MCEGKSLLLNVILFFMYVRRPPPLFSVLSFLISVKFGMVGDFDVAVSFVSWIVIISALVSFISCCNS